MTDFMIFSMVKTRLDIVYRMILVSCFAKNLLHQHTKVVKTIFQYLKRFHNCEIIHGKDQELCIVGYSDSNWAGNKKSEKSTSGFIFMPNIGPVSWCSIWQSMLVLLFTKTKYIALILAVKEGTWLQLLLIELGFL